MIPYSYKDNIVFQGAKQIISGGVVGVDSRQADFAALKNGHEKVTLEAGDYIYHNGIHLLLVEEKKLPDLYDSWRSRRLQRQLRHLLEANPDGINILALRGSARHALQEIFWQGDVPELALDLLKWQVHGGLIGFLPARAGSVVATIKEWGSVLKPGRGIWDIVRGDDRTLAKRKRIGREEKDEDRPTTPVEAALQRLLPGVGRVRSRVLGEACGQNLLAFYAADDETLKRWGVTPSVLRKLREVVS